MANLKQLRANIYNINQCQKLCNSMYNLASMKMMNFKSKLDILSKKLSKLGSIIKKYNIYQNEIKNQEENKQTFIFTSDFGFCGEFNRHMQDEKVVFLGKKSNSDVGTSDIDEFTSKINLHIGNNYNFEFMINNGINGKIERFNCLDFVENAEIELEDFLTDFNYENLKIAYKNLFLNYVYTFGILHENIFRSRLMKNASDNSKDILNNLVINCNKIRQSNITGEILLIISCQEVTS